MSLFLDQECEVKEPPEVSQSASTKPGLASRQGGARPAAHHVMSFCLPSSVDPGQPEVPVFPTQSRCPPLSLQYTAACSNFSYYWVWRTFILNTWVPGVWQTDDASLPGCACLLLQSKRWRILLVLPGVWAEKLDCNDVLPWYVTRSSHLLPTHCSVSPSHLSGAPKTPGIAPWPQVSGLQS